MGKGKKAQRSASDSKTKSVTILESPAVKNSSGQQKSKGKGKAEVPASSTSPKATTKSKSTTSEPTEPETIDQISSFDNEEVDEDSDSEDDGVDEEGMARLMKALGADGLDEMGQAELDALEGGNSDEDQESDEADDQQVDGEQESDDEEVIEEGEGLSDEASDDEQNAEVPLDELSDVDEDAVSRQKIEVDNKMALDQIRDSIKLDASLPWTETLVVSYPHTIDVEVDDDLNRELAFYKQALHGANTARALAAKHSFPFTRPADYFAEMVKSDAHMERIRIRLLNESSGIKKSEDKRKEREGKKFGKQVQVEKLKEREKNKKEMDERLKSLKRKRKDVLDGPRDNVEEFDVAVEDAISDHPAKRGKAGNGKSIPRSVRDKKYGFGGAGRRSKQNTKKSTDDFDGSKTGRGQKGSGGQGGRHKSKRLGKSRRQTARSK